MIRQVPRTKVCRIAEQKPKLGGSKSPPLLRVRSDGGDYLASDFHREDSTLLADIESLRLFSGIHPLHFEFHRMLANRFPFGIYYREHGDEAQVFAVLDLRRNPN